MHPPYGGGGITILFTRDLFAVAKFSLVTTIANVYSEVSTERTSVQWRRSQVKSGGINIEIEKIEGVGSGNGLCPPQLGVWGLPPEKKIKFALKNYAILSMFWYFFPILQQKVGDLPPPALRPMSTTPQVTNTTLLESCP